MPGLDAHAETCPGADEVRAALGHMAASDAFRGSPQLVAFLRYVVEATLRGGADRIKGYTIAVEALGRTADFDPQSDPIVRVEATRLRRALNRYYQNGGAADPVVIDLPLGNYVPVFRRRACPEEKSVPPTVAPVPPPSALESLLEPPTAPTWRHRALGLALVCAGAALYGGLDFWFDFNTPAAPAISFVQPRPAVTAPRNAPIYPVIFVGAFRSVARNGSPKPTDTLRGKLRDALARFDEVQVVAGMPFDSRGHGVDGEIVPSRYALTASVETEDAGMVSFSVRLTDAVDGHVAYARTFDRLQRDDNLLPDEDAIIREVSAALARPYGIVQAHEQAKEFAAAGEAHYHCLLEAYDYWRTYDPQQHVRARDCLERMTEMTPGFALGFAALAAIVLEEHRDGVNTRPEAPPALRRAMQAARRAVELRPGSARAHQALADVQFARGDYALALELGERAVTLNPYDPVVLADHGARLVALGEVERGARLIKEAAAASVVRPAWHDFFLFLTAYLAGDDVGAARYAALMPSDTYPLGMLARALAALRQGEADHARQLLDRLAALRPGWRNDYDAELKRYFPSGSIIERLSRDLARIGSVERD